MATPPLDPLHVSTHSVTSMNRIGDFAYNRLQTSRLELAWVGMDLVIRHQHHSAILPARREPRDGRPGYRRNWPMR